MYRPRLQKIFFPVALGFAVMVAALASSPAFSETRTEKGIGVVFGGASATGEAIKGFDDTRHHRQLAIGGNAFVRYVFDSDYFFGWRVGFHHIRTDIRRGEKPVATFAMFPIMVHFDVGRVYGDYLVDLRGGIGGNITSVGNDVLLRDIVLDPESGVTAIEIDSKVGGVAGFGFGVERRLSALSSVVLEGDFFYAYPQTSWTIRGDADRATVPYVDAEFPVKSASVMLGIRIRLSGTPTEG